MKKIFILVLIVIALGAAVYLYVAMNSTATNTPNQNVGGKVGSRVEKITIEKKGNLGIATTLSGEKYLVDRDGMTLYYNIADEGQSGQSIEWSCKSECENEWLPYLSDENSIALSASTDSLLKTLNLFTRSWGDNRQQYAIYSKLLYRFHGDKAPGELRGDMGGEWMVARP